MVRIVWQGLVDGSLERAEVDAGRGIRVTSSVDALGAGWTYRLESGDDEVFRSLRLRSDRGDEVAIDHDGKGGWTVDGHPRADLVEAREIDLAISPVTNALPVRRLGLHPGERADIVTAYLAFPTLEVVADPQRYTRLDDRIYRYESRDSDFRRDITVDEDGLVVDYPGLFARV